MYQDTYYVTKSSGTLTDALLAYGVAVVLHNLLLAAGKASRFAGVAIRDQGAYYHLSLRAPIQEEWVQLPLPHDQAMAVQGKKALDETVPSIHYDLIWEDIRKEQEQRALRRAARAQQEAAVQELVEETRTQPHRNVALLLGDYRLQVLGIHNQAVMQWVQMMEVPAYRQATLRAFLSLFAHPWADIDAIEKAWAKEVKEKGIKRRLSVSQVYNPSRGKGLIRSLGDTLRQENYQSFWLLEYLKAVGLFAAAAPRAFTEEKMRKIYVLAPRSLTLSAHHEIFAEHFEPVFYGLGVSPIKADIVASLQYASAYLSYYLASSGQEEALDPNPSSSVAGFHVASYSLLSQHSYTMINLSFVGLPPWLRQIETEEDVLAVQAVIKEHEQLLRPLQEELQEGNALLRDYRDFLAGNQAEAFFDFCLGYGEYVLHTLRSTVRIKQMSIASLDELLRRISMSTTDHVTAEPEGAIGERDDLTEFRFASGKHPGFHAIAYAIRQSTVVPQRQLAECKSNQQSEKPLYAVRYGLGQQLRRKANSARELMEALGEFVQEYNAETSQVFENTSDERRADPHTYARTHYRQRVFLEDLDDVFLLVKTYGPRLVCNLLVAYGYAATGRRKDLGTQEAGNDPSPSPAASIDEREDLN